MIRIYVDQVSERLLYVLDFVLRDRGIEYAVTNDRLFFLDSQGVRLNYSEYELPDVINFKPASVLFDEDIRKYEIATEDFEGEECLCFDGTDDPLASIFYLLSRYEEYLIPAVDNHDRFDMTKSLQVRYGWVEKVMCDRWAEAFIRYLSRHANDEIAVFKPPLTMVPTFDIDNAYAFQLKEGVRHWGAMAKDYMKRDRIRLSERRQVMSGARKDPYDTYELIESTSDEGFDVKVFWLLGDYRAYDRNISFRDPRHQRLIRRIAQKAAVGIHPSYRSNTYSSLLSEEKQRLEQILGHTVLHSRQHFLKLSIPMTYHRLLESGIKHDFTMGMADRVGFRAGTSRPFKWFDLEKDCVTELVIHPFAYMDGTLNEYLDFRPEEAMSKISSLYNEVRQFGGEFTFIWHNETIGDYGKWEGWKKVFEFTLSLK